MDRQTLTNSLQAVINADPSIPYSDKMSLVSNLDELPSVRSIFTQGIVDQNGTVLLGSQNGVLGAIPASSLAAAVMRYVFVGDSRTDPGNNTWADRLGRGATALANVTKINTAVSGRTPAQMDAAFAAEIAPYSPNTTGIRALYGTWGVTNGIGGGQTGAQVIASTKSQWNKARAAGFYPILGFTETPRSDVGWTGNTQLATYNTFARSAATGTTDGCDILIDVAALFPDSTSSDYTDGLHITAASQEILAGAVWAAINHVSGIASLRANSILLVNGSAIPFQVSNLKDVAFTVATSAAGDGAPRVFIGTGTTNGDVVITTNGAETYYFSRTGTFTFPTLYSAKVGGGLAFGGDNRVDVAYSLTTSVPSAGDNVLTLSTSTATDILLSPNGNNAVRITTGGNLTVASGFAKAKLQTAASATTGLTPGVLAATTNASIVLYDGGGQAYRVPCII